MFSKGDIKLYTTNNNYGGNWTDSGCIYSDGAAATGYTTEEICTQIREWTVASSGYYCNCSDGLAQSHTEETDCLSTLGSWTDGSCNNVSYDNREECRANAVNVWTDASYSDDVSTNEGYRSLPSIS